MPDARNPKNDAGDAVENVAQNLVKALDDLREEVSKLNRRGRGGPPRGLFVLLIVALVGVAVAVLNGRSDRDDADADDWS